MKLNIIKNLFLAVSFFWTISVFSQAEPSIHVNYGNPSIEIANGGTVSFGSSTEIEFSITNIPNIGNPSLSLANPSITLSNTNFVISSPPSDENIKKTEVGLFRIRKNNFECNSIPQSTVVTIYSNAKNYPVFTFTITFTNAPTISVLGGSPTQPIPNGQTVPTSTNGTLFGTIDVLSSTTRNYAIVNTGTCPLVLNSLTCFTYNPETGLPSPDFAIIALITPLGVSLAVPYTINPGGTAILVVRFTPQSTGVKEAIISLPNNDATKSPYTYVIKGEGYNPTITGPGGINADFRLWLKANRGINLTSGTKVETWKDLGSLGKDASQATLENRPTFIDAASSNINFNPVVKFENNGSSLNQYMYNIVNGYYTHETFIVMVPDGAVSSPMTIISGTSAANPSYPNVPDEYTGIGLGNFTSRLTNEKLWFNQWQNTDSPYYSVADDLGDYSKPGIINTRNKTLTASDGMDILFNSNDVGNQTSVSSGLSYSNLGYNDGGLWKGTPYNIGKNYNDLTYGNLNGRVAEIISYASRVPDSDRIKIETYLAIKYGITLGVNGTSKNYVDTGGSIIWNVTDNAGFNYNIAGIGSNVDSDLNQKQSKSINDTNEVTIGLGVISSTNKANINEFQKDRDFLIWGSDNGTYTEGGSNTTTIGSGLTTSTTRINKKWKIVETKNDVLGDVGNVFVSIPAAAFSTFTKLASEEYSLIVSDNANFADSGIIDIIPLKSDGNGNLQTWYDFDGTKYFTFGKSAKLESKSLVNITSAGNDFLVGEYALNLNSGSFTVGCWIRNDGTSLTNKTIFGKGANLQVRINSENKIEALWDGVSRFASNTVVADGKWHNIVAVYYVGSADLYIDGVVETSTFSLQNPTPNFSRFSVGGIYIDKNNIIDPFRGEIDQINIWDMALSSDQINYIMNQEVEKYTDNTTTNGKVIPHYATSNSVKTILWSKLRAYYDFNSFYGTTIEGLTDDRNFLRIKYLNKDKNIINTQTAPLPYETIADGLWDNPSTWKNGSLQTIPNDNSVIIQTPQPLVNGNIVKILNNVESTGNKTLLGLFVEGTNASTYKTLTANNDSKIEVSHYLKLDGLIDLKDKSQLVQTLNSELDSTSIGFIKRSQQGTVNKYNYNYWSSPVGPINGSTNNNNYTVSGEFKDGSTATPQDINWVSGYDGIPTTPISIARYWLYKFENGSEYPNWIHFNETDEIRPSQGFTLKGSDALTSSQNYTFIGKPHNGLINDNSVIPDNIFLVGNPYPSAIDAFEFIKDNLSIANGGRLTEDVINGELYFWEHAPDNNTHILSDYTGGYSTLTLVGGAPPIAPIGINGVGTSNKLSYQYIPVGQGFFVSGPAGNGVSQPIIFNNNQRSFVKEDAIDDISAPISNTMFKKRPNKGSTSSHFKDNSNDVVYNNYNTKIRLGFNSANNFHRQLLIGFMNEEANDGVNNGYDGYQLDTQLNDLYFLIDNSEYTIQGVGAFDNNKAYPIGVKTNVAGTVKLMVDATEFLPPNQNIYIYDKETSVYYDITKNAAEINLLAGTYNARFELTFKTNNSLEIEESKFQESMLLVYNNEIKKKLFISKNQSINIKEVSIYNISGQQLITLKEASDLDFDTIEIPFNVQSGTYIVKVITDKDIIVKKILK